MNDDASARHRERKRRSFVEAAELYQPIVPLPGQAAVVRPDPVLDDLPAVTGPQPIPTPPSSPVLVAPRAPSPPTSSIVRPAPPDGALTPELTPQVSSERPAVPSAQAAPPAQEDTPLPTAAVPAHPARSRGPWPWAVLLALGVAGAGAGALWVRHARHPAPVPHQTAMVQLSSPEAPTTAASPAGNVGPQSGTAAPHAASEPPPAAPPPGPEPTIAGAASAPLAAPPPDAAAAVLPAPAMPPAPAPAAPPPDAPGLQLSSVPHATSEPAASALPIDPEPVATRAAPAPPTARQPDAADPVPTLAAPAAPAVSEPAPPVSTAAQAPERIVIYYRRASPVAATEAAGLADHLRPHAAQVDLRAASAIPRRPTVRYFWPEDAIAAQDLVTVLGRAPADWRVQSVSPRRTRPPRGTFEVWLPAS